MLITPQSLSRVIKVPDWKEPTYSDCLPDETGWQPGGLGTQRDGLWILTVRP